MATRHDDRETRWLMVRDKVLRTGGISTGERMATRRRKKESPDALTGKLRAYYAEECERAQARYVASPDDFYASWHYLSTHPIVNTLEGQSLFTRALWVFAAKVDPETRTVEEDTRSNTQVEIWLELGPTELADDAPSTIESRYLFTHDCDLDCGGDTYEDAIVNLAALVAEHYGHDRSKVYESR